MTSILLLEGQVIKCYVLEVKGSVLYTYKHRPRQARQERMSVVKLLYAVSSQGYAIMLYVFFVHHHSFEAHRSSKTKIFLSHTHNL